MIRTAVYTLGCKLNQCESEALADAFSHQGFELVHHSRIAELYLVNTCTVTSKAEQKARRMIRKFASGPGSPLVLVTGCYAQMEPEELRKLAGTVAVVPMEKKPALLQLPGHIAAGTAAGYTLRESVLQWLRQSGGQAEAADPFSYKAAEFQYHARAFVKVEDGCDNTCAYCRVTLARGAAVGLDKQEAGRRIGELEMRGYREVVLTGVNLTAYRSGDDTLVDLLSFLLERLTTVRIRLSSLEPDMITDSLIAVCSHELIQPHFHIPVQSGSDSILRRVNRSYTAETVLRVTERLREVKDDPFIAADLITGLPGETEEDFRSSAALLKAADFSQVHVFPYSPRPGTALYHAPDHVPEHERDRRSAELRSISSEQHRRYIERWIGRETTAILEQRKDFWWRGLSANYLQLKIFGTPDSSAYRRGEEIRVRIRGCAEDGSIEADCIAGGSGIALGRKLSAVSECLHRYGEGERA